MNAGFFPTLCAYLLDAVLGFFQVQQSAEPLRLFHRMYVLALQVLHDRHLDGLSIGEVDRCGPVRCSVRLSVQRGTAVLLR